MNTSKYAIYVHPGTVAEARRWADPRGIDRRRVLSSRQARSNSLHGSPAIAQLVPRDLAGMATPVSLESWQKLLAIVSEHNAIACLTHTKRKQASA